MTESNWNRQGRLSGGYRPTRFNMPNLSKEDLEILKQEAMIRKEFGEEGVKKFWELIANPERRTVKITSDDTDLIVIRNRPEGGEQ